MTSKGISMTIRLLIQKPDGLFHSVYYFYNELFLNKWMNKLKSRDFKPQNGTIETKGVVYITKRGVKSNDFRKINESESILQG